MSNREEAIAVMKDIVQKLPTLDSNAVVVMPPNSDDVTSSSYQIHIKASIDSSTLAQLEAIVRQHSFAINVQPINNLVVIYKAEKIESKLTQ